MCQNQMMIPPNINRSRHQDLFKSTSKLSNQLSELTSFSSWAVCTSASIPLSLRPPSGTISITKRYGDWAVSHEYSSAAYNHNEFWGHCPSPDYLTCRLKTGCQANTQNVRQDSPRILLGLFGWGVGLITIGCIRPLLWSKTPHLEDDRQLATIHRLDTNLREPIDRNAGAVFFATARWLRRIIIVNIVKANW